MYTVRVWVSIHMCTAMCLATTGCLKKMFKKLLSSIPSLQNCSENSRYINVPRLQTCLLKGQKLYKL